MMYINIILKLKRNKNKKIEKKLFNNPFNELKKLSLNS